MESSAAPVTNAREAFHAALNPPQLPPRENRTHEVLKKVLFSAWGQSVIGALIVMVVLYVLNPPMVQSKNESDISHATRDSRKILVWGGITAALIFGLPLAYQQLQKKR